MALPFSAAVPAGNFQLINPHLDGVVHLPLAGGNVTNNPHAAPAPVLLINPQHSVIVQLPTVQLSGDENPDTSL